MVAAFLLAQLEMVDSIITTRNSLIFRYFEGLQALAEKGFFQLPRLMDKNDYNGHGMYLMSGSLQERDRLISYLGNHSISAIPHYFPLHRSLMGKKHGRVCGNMDATIKAAERLLRLPLFYEMPHSDVEWIVHTINRFYQKDRD